MKSALGIVAAIRAGETSALAETDAAIARIETRDGALNAVVVRDFDRARAAARVFDATGDKSLPLAGAPMTVKESFDVAGLPTTFGFVEHRGFMPADDAVVVKRLKAAGAIILGKTNVPPALADLQSNNAVYGRTNNAIDPSRVAGGSSGGSAVALASGMVPLEFGSDIGGSIRVPAAFNGVWGHKPTWGVVPYDGHFSPGTDSARTVLSVVGPMARDADDLAVTLDIVADHPLAPAPVRAPGEWRVMLLTAHPMAKVQGAIVAAIDALGERFAAAGAAVDRASDLLPDLTRQHEGYWALLNLALARRHPSSGEAVPLETWHHLHDEQARIQRQWRALFERYDAVIAPTVGMTAFAHDEEPLATRRLDINGEDTQFFHQFAFPGLATFPMLPATSVPVGRDGDGMPIGVQVIADLFADHTAIAVAKAAHDLTRSAA